VGSGEKGAVWTDESTGSNSDHAGIEEGAVAVDLNTFAESRRMSLGAMLEAQVIDEHT
jgi:hypothetical protein